MPQIFRKVHDPTIVSLYNSNKPLADIAKKTAADNTSIITTLIFLIRVIRHPIHHTQFIEDPTKIRVIPKNLHHAFYLQKFIEYQNPRKIKTAKLTTSYHIIKYFDRDCRGNLHITITQITEGPRNLNVKIQLKHS